MDIYTCFKHKRWNMTYTDIYECEMCKMEAEIERLNERIRQAEAIIKADICGNCTMKNACKDGYECEIADFLGDTDGI